MLNALASAANEQQDQALFDMPEFAEFSQLLLRDCVAYATARARPSLPNKIRENGKFNHITPGVPTNYYWPRKTGEGGN